MDKIKYDQNLSTILLHLEANYPNIAINRLSARDKIKYYVTKFFIDSPPHISELMDEILEYEIYAKPVLDIGQSGSHISDNFDISISIIKHDITQIKADAIVNAANADGLGCFEYDHKCIDNIINNKAGPKLRLECKSILGKSKIATSGVIITKGYNLPAKYVIHTVGPIYDKINHHNCVDQLADCYINCLELATKLSLNNIVFCCISTGIYGFPADRAADIALLSVKTFLEQKKSPIKIIFCTYTDADYELYLAKLF